ncbi:MAG: universal stress protein, partial [Verrucomicrobiaceae bacterium]
MYQKVLVALDPSASDAAVLEHVARLAPLHQSAILLVHVADGWAARNFERLNLAESEEMARDRRYLEDTAQKLQEEMKQTVNVKLALGNPPDEIVKVAHTEKCDLILMASHGHRFFSDLWHGSTIDQVRHNTHI